MHSEAIPYPLCRLPGYPACKAEVAADDAR
jgi:hypothetical protein